MWLVLAIASFAVAVVFSMLGQGGGVMYTPLQVWLGIDFHQAATTSLFLIMVTSLAASLVFRKAGRIDLPLAIVLESVTAAGAFGGGLASDRLSARVLSILFAVVVASAAVFMIRQMKERRPRSKPLAGRFRWRRTLGEQTYSVNLAIALPISFLAGTLSAMMGIGGGVIKVPLMVLALGIPTEIAVGSSALMVGMTAGGGFAGHVLSGHWSWRISLILAVAVFIGAQIGSRISVGLDSRKLKRRFGWFLVVIAGTMLFRAFG
jgi:uncharacterized membrane protein YfcA